MFPELNSTIVLSLSKARITTIMFPNRRRYFSWCFSFAISVYIFYSIIKYSHSILWPFLQQHFPITSQNSILEPETPMFMYTYSYHVLNPAGAAPHVEEPTWGYYLFWYKSPWLRYFFTGVLEEPPPTPPGKERKHPQLDNTWWMHTFFMIILNKTLFQRGNT